MDWIAAAGAGWLGSALRSDQSRWRVPIPEPVLAELSSVVGPGSRIDADDPRVIGLPESASLGHKVLRELGPDGTGLVLLTGLPVEDEVLAEQLYWAFGRMLGRPVSQSRKGDLIGRVEDRGSDISRPTQRGYESSAALPFHVDRTDIISLLCVRTARKGGLSQVVSVPTVHDLMLAESPRLLAELYRPIPQDRRGEELPGEEPWVEMPVFSRTSHGVIARYVRRFIEASQRHQAAPRLTAGQIAAMDALDEILRRADVVLEMELAPGEIQLINNFTVLHARTAFTSEASGAGRLLLRLWLTVHNSTELPEHFRPLYQSIDAGTVRGGVWPELPKHLIGAPVAGPA